MTALPDHSPGWPPRESDRLLTVAEYAALGEPDFGYTELVEGRLMMSPSPTPRHNIASFELAAQLKPQLPSNLTVVQDVDVDLGLVPADSPGFSRRPDLVIVERAAIDRVGDEGGMLRASEVVVVIEIVSPSSHRIDYKHKHGEYADASIPYYWILDLSDPLSLAASHLAGEFGYQDAPAVTEMFSTSEPFDIQVALNQLA
ncbi:MAG: Uma2 family endonuclease [Actinophytocola sp.]|nr:Uma2 family endonuclease [Actinophytocola sp.]